MNPNKPSHKDERLDPGWHSRGYLPHFDGVALPQFLTLHLGDSVPKNVIERWQRQLTDLSEEEARIVLQRRVEKYLDQGFGECFLRDFGIANMVQESLLKFDGIRYNLFSWVIMPNHSHSLFTRFEDWELWELMKSHKSYTAHEANKMLNRKGQFWMVDYFDRYIRNTDHFRKTVQYVENNPVKAGLCEKPGDWPFSSAWFREHTKK
jgi:putative DNA methylase